MKNLIINISLFLLLSLVGCTPSKKVTTMNPSTNTTTEGIYGYSEKNPIKVEGLADSGPSSEHAYLNKLAGPNGEKIKYGRDRSCCPFKTPNALFGDSGMLDVYTVTWKGCKEPIKLYLNMYDPADEKLRAPNGLTLK